jgi:hypothetical protein
MSEGDGVPEAELARIAAICAGKVTFRLDGWRRLIHMEGLRFLVGDTCRTMDAVLCLNHDNGSYPTKLYLEENVGAGLNWNETAHLLGRSWVTFSWSGIQPNQPPFEILAAHLAPLSKKTAA